MSNPKEDAKPVVKDNETYYDALLHPAAPADSVESEVAAMCAHAKLKAEAAHAMISDLCHGRREWIMSIPAREDHDPDLVIGGALRGLERALVATEQHACSLTRQLREADFQLRAVDTQLGEEMQRAQAAEAKLAALKERVMAEAKVLLTSIDYKRIAALFEEKHGK